MRWRFQKWVPSGATKRRSDAPLAAATWKSEHPGHEVTSEFPMSEKNRVIFPNQILGSLGFVAGL